VVVPKRLWSLNNDVPIVDFLSKHLDEATVHHSLRIAKALYDDGYGSDVADVALFHDFIEDVDNGAEVLLAAGFPSRLEAHVQALTHDPEETYEAYIARIQIGHNIPRVVKVYDIVDNLTRDSSGISGRRAERLRIKYRQALAQLVQVRSIDIHCHSNLKP
jgi:hypothetical protein